MSDATDEPLLVRAEAVLSRTEDCRAPTEPETYDGLRGTELDREIGEIDALLAEIDGGPAVTVARLEARLGLLLCVRFVLGGSDEDRVRAQDLLAAARQYDVLSERERDTTRKQLVVLLARRLGGVTRESFDPLDTATLQQMMWVGRPGSQGGPGYVEDLQLLYRLAVEAGLAEQLPAPVRQLMDTLDSFAAVRMDDRESVAGFAEELRGKSAHLPGPLRHTMETAAMLMRDNGTPAFPSSGSSGSPGSPVSPDRPEPPGARGEGGEEDEGDDSFIPEFLAMMEATSPQSVRGEEVPALIERLSQPDSPLPSRMIAVMLQISLGMRTGDRGRLHSALTQLQKAAADGEFADGSQALWLHGTLSMLLMLAGETGGSLLDTEAAEDLLEGLPAVPADGDGGAMRVLADCLRVQLRLRKLQETRDLAATDQLIDELHDFDTGPLTEAGMPGVLGYTLGYAYLSRAYLSGSRADMHQAVVHMRDAVESLGGLAAFETLSDVNAAPVNGLAALLGSDPEELRQGLRRTRSVLGKPGVTFDFEVKTRVSLAIGLEVLHLRTGDPDLMDEGVTELETACRLLPPEGAPDAQSVYWLYASRLADRAAARPGTAQAAEDLPAAVRAARQSLRAVADEVLLQLGVRHGLSVARRGADHGCTAASWALAAGRVDEAIDCLEAGRSLVLAAAAESRSVTDRLEALGATGLAARWRDAVASATPDVGAPLSVEAVFAAGAEGPRLPGDVRRQALDLLRTDAWQGGEPTPAERVAALRDGLTRADVDALVHLLPGGGTDDGAVLLVTPKGPARSVPLSALSAEGRAPLAAFLAAEAERKRVDADAGSSPQEARRAEARWREALDEVCVWAGEVLTPVLDTLDVWPRALAESGLADATAGDGRDARPVRLVLVPCGSLGAAPWPSALLRPPQGLGGPGTVRAFEVSVITHAASGQEFLRASARTRMRPAERPALAFHGDDLLAWAEEEIALLHEVYYPHAEVYRDQDAPATPGTVLSLLGGRAESAASLVHLSCHGIAGPDPTTSALRLAPSRPGGSTGGDGSGDDEPLTLAVLLETPHDGEAYRSRGPLVVCGACETDLTTRDHDEALTLTSVLVHRLAADAVGTRWGVDDDESEILMLVLHDRLAAGAAPPDALRAAQRWMLADPGRRPPVRALERVRARRWNRDFRHTDVWAAFVHHGNPSGGTPQ
ncbi:CHAT domain-containing protein [Streptomyces sp. A13(2022)]|uniref:CHAT domain-containing protein n=1 Tax=Streptomyces sp. A13(2022) TaxID=2964768 RepID=UPI0021DB48FB|nr:CHAT domain-containing protein [Streptomyces sp. A13(2022)]MCU8593931.1 CHAT domain-containing protein [Streptomyces sp. A13(2022)]